MKKNSTHRKTPRSTEEVSRDKELRSRFQSERPTLESLVDSGEYHAPIAQQEYFGLMQFVAHLKKCREEQNLSLADVAKLSGIDKAALSRIENGLAENPTVLTLERIAHSIGKCLRLSLEDSSAGGQTR